MAIEADITQILATPGAVVRGLGRQAVASGSALLQEDTMHRVEAMCWDATAAINVAAGTITFTAVPVGAHGANAVMIGNATGVAATGQLAPPGFLYSDFFSGCLFYLFRDDYGSVYGVHSYRSGTYPDPMPYFNRLGCTLLYFFDTGGVFTPLGAGVFGSVICYVSPNKIVVDFFAMQGNGQVVQVVNHTRIDNWRNAAAIAAPAVPNAMAPYMPPVQPPAARGLKHRVAKFVLDYI